MRYTLRQIQYFIATAETGSITLASERVHISQPSISTAIANLEEELKTQLFVRRHAQGLTLTQAGKAILAQAKYLIEQAENLYVVASEVTQSARGSLSVGCMVTLASMIVPELTHSFCARYAEAVINNVISDHDDLLRKLVNGEIDLALSYDLLIPDGCDFVRLAKLSPLAVLGVTHPLASRSSLSLKDLEREPLLLLDLPLSREYFLALFFKLGLVPRIGMRSPYQDVLRTTAANGYGYTLTNVRPRSRIAMDGRALKYIRLEDETEPMSIGLISRSDMRKTRLIELFYDHCRELISDHSIPGMDVDNYEK